MTAHKHTRGPWGLCDSSDARSKGYVRSCAQAQPGDPINRPAVCRVTPTGHSADTYRANVRLIEAAPDLLAVCERLIDRITQHDMLHSARLEDGLTLDGHLVAQLRAAAKKAGALLIEPGWWSWKPGMRSTGVCTCGKTPIYQKDDQLRCDDCVPRVVAR